MVGGGHCWRHAGAFQDEGRCRGARGSEVLTMWLALPGMRLPVFGATDQPRPWAASASRPLSMVEQPVQIPFHCVEDCQAAKAGGPGATSGCSGPVRRTRGEV